MFKNENTYFLMMFKNGNTYISKILKIDNTSFSKMFKHENTYFATERALWSDDVFEDVFADMRVDGAERIVQEIDVGVLVDGSR